jgi:hypothetical protein
VPGISSLGQVFLVDLNDHARGRLTNSSAIFRWPQLRVCSRLTLCWIWPTA